AGPRRHGPPRTLTPPSPRGRQCRGSGAWLAEPRRSGILEPTGARHREEDKLDLRTIEISKKKMEEKFKQAVLSLPAQAMTERNLKYDQDFEAWMTKEKESTMTILATEETNLEERYGIMVAVENEDGQFGNLTAEESLQQAPGLNSTETDMVSEMPAAPEGAETSIQLPILVLVTLLWFSAI
ncbi:hypothetical protein EJB05_47392, partial [Eragrostis curvula]